MFVLFILIFEVQRIAFLCCNLHDLGCRPMGDYLRALAAGLPLDASVAGYLSAPMLVMATVELWWRHRAMVIIERSYLALVAFAIAAITVLDAVLYGYWHFRLDVTPLFYFFSSPSAAMASAPTAAVILGPLLIVALTVGLTFLLWKVYAHPRLAAVPVVGRSRLYAAALHVVAAALLFVAIRGGVTVSTMNLSRAYFSNDRALNHLAINPQLSLLYSGTHQADFASQYRFLSEEEASAEFFRLTGATFAPTDSLLREPTPDIYIIIAESFSAHLMPSLGGEAVAVELDAIAADGLLLTNFYASSFRTDRALPAILSGFPAQPNTSVMKYVEKAEKLPSLPAALRQRGYQSSYYYGGDANFTNMLAYLKNQGFTSVVSDADFPLSQRLSKWGAHDHVLFDRVIADVDRTPADAVPQFRVIQTSSSHEPFEVPFHKSFHPDDPERQLRANAFAYTDSCIGHFVRHLKASPRWAHSLLIIVPDHYGAYPDIADVRLRHHIPLIITGGALNAPPQRIATVASQIDIAATLLAMLNINSSQFTFSHNIFDPDSPHFAFFTEPEYMGFVTDSSTIIYNLDANRLEVAIGDSSSQSLTQAKAFLQTLYNTLDRL